MADQQPVDDALLSRFLAGETSPDESAHVRKWLDDQATGPAETSVNPDDGASIDQKFKKGKPDQRLVNLDGRERTLQQKKRLSDRQPAPRTQSGRKTPPFRSDKYPVDGYEAVWQVTAVLILVVGMGWLIYRLCFMGQDHAAASMVTLTTNTQKISKTLPDGSRILLNPHSTFRYPATFSDERWDITLTGEAFFTLTPDATRPFRIVTNNTVVEGVDASFSICAYDANVNVEVRTGAVRVSRGGRVVVLTKNQRSR